MSNKSVENILDSLFENTQKSDDITFTDEITIPKRCSLCKNSIICSVLPTLISLSKIKIFVGIEQCPYFTTIKLNESRKDNKTI